MITLTSKPDGTPAEERNPFDFPIGKRRLLESREDALFNDLNISTFDNGFNSCCASFIAPGRNFRQLDIGTYIKLKEYVMDIDLDDQQTGRTGFEFIIYRIWNDPSPTRDSITEWYSSADALAKTDEFQKRIEACTKQATTKAN